MMNVLIKNLTGLALLSVVTLGCSNRIPDEVQTKPDVDNVNPNYTLIAKNLVSTLGLLDSISELTTTFQMLAPKTDFGKAVLSTIENEGYGVQLVTGDLGSDFLRYKAELSQTENGTMETYSLSVGSIDVNREYAVVDGNTVPTSPVTVRSNETILDEVDDGIFEIYPEAYDPSVSSIVQINNDVPVLQQLDNFVNQTNHGYLPNVNDLQESNFARLFDDYYDITKETLYFQDDSLSLGGVNKKKLADLADSVNPETDLISVIGCSHGDTSIANGNQVLAEGRAQRVTESLMIAGLDPELILDEACWASEYWDEFAPRRGVIVTHKRLSDEG